MSLVFLDVRASCNYPIKPCDFVALCLTDEWAEKTVNGYAIAVGNITTINKYVSPTPQVSSPCCPSSTITCPPECIFQVQVDDSQFLVDPDTDLPYEITDDDVTGIFPYGCIAENLMLGPDWYLKVDDVTLTPNAVANNLSLYLPIFNRITGDLVDSTTVVFPGDEIAGDVETADITFTSSAGEITVMNVCDLFESCIDGETIIRDPGTGLYSAVIPDVPTCDAIEPCFDGVTITRTGPGNTYEAVQTPESFGAVEGTSAGATHNLDMTADTFNQTADTTSLLTINNLSTTRSMGIFVSLVNNAQVICDTTGVWRYSGEAAVNGGGYVTVTQSQWGTYPGIIGTVWLNVGIFVVTIVPSGSYTIRARQRVTTLVTASGTSTWVSGNVGLNIIGTSI